MQLPLSTPLLLAIFFAIFSLSAHVAAIPTTYGPMGTPGVRDKREPGTCGKKDALPGNTESNQLIQYECTIGGSIHHKDCPGECLGSCYLIFEAKGDLGVDCNPPDTGYKPPPSRTESLKDGVKKVVNNAKEGFKKFTGFGRTKDDKAAPA